MLRRINSTITFAHYEDNYNSIYETLTTECNCSKKCTDGILPCPLSNILECSKATPED